jgi:hypothetical protein
MGKIAGTALGLYVLVAIVAVPYFNWQYAREHGFVAWLLLGEVISTAKGRPGHTSLPLPSSLPNGPRTRRRTYGISSGLWRRVGPRPDSSTQGQRRR